MALGMDLIADPAKRAKTADRFVAKLAADNNHLKTGFLGTPWLLPALSRIGRDDLAFRLLLNEDYPSWGFQIKMGATTLWERWNTIRDNGDFGPVDMNSFTHYAYGAVADWMYGRISGIQAVEPGYRKSRVAPLIGGGGLTAAKGSLRTAYGMLSSEWSSHGGGFTLHVKVPPNTTSEVVIPTTRPQAVMEGASPAASAVGVKDSKFTGQQLILHVGSGEYVFSVSGATTAGH